MPQEGAVPGASKLLGVYEDTITILQSILIVIERDIYMSQIKVPKTVQQAVSHLMTELSVHDKRKVMNTSKDNLETLHISLAMDIRNDFGLWSGNEKLLESCWNML